MLYERYLRAYAEQFRKTDRNMWNYEDGCVLIGLRAMYQATGDNFYLNALRSFTDRYIEVDGNIRNYVAAEYNLDYIPAGCVLYTLYDKTCEPRYRKAIETLEEQLRHQPRTPCGSFWHKAIYPNQVWLDGLYMGLPFHANYAIRFGDESALDDIMLQFRNARKYLYDEKTGLYYHAWNETKDVFWADPKTGLSPNFWTRAIGWYLMALADIYGMIPDNRTDLIDEMAALWKEAIDGMLRWQEKDSGLFYQLPALPNEKRNYLETSGSLMVAYSLLKGARLDVLTEPEYRAAGEKILVGIELRKFTVHDGKVELHGICKGAGLGPTGNLHRNGTVDYYLSEDVVHDEQKGVGVCMMAYAEYLQAKQAGALTDDFPKVEIFNKGYDPIMPGDPAFIAFEKDRAENAANKTR